MSRFSNDLDGRLPLYGALVLRLGLAGVMIAHALLKLLVFTLPGTASFFEAHGFPGWTAYPVFGAELIGGVLLAIGVWTRLVAVALVPVMLGALAVHWPNGWMFVAPHGGWEYPAFLTLALVAQALLGGGALSVRFPRAALPVAK
ncbi:DoxX family protein OS=Burkholderia vietnamiensis (strain G4 / LMG 22486) GN=Bcep1808_3970 PE=4 SV=1: DoxX [Gemmata massiliana]|uniref:DoxX family protein n=1 Tax=Gemmata massiliana TaxID=1210884 RepID=A0A6P2D637_9BACT|nr:DoxX family protein [Gemmata massiliana]VTR95594.1 DoxX family protein OS=Burkholderia vietnamiensis (strain G4 / LMG 22486) GN=Bcep1808_3970 PE=4 SV=1: DoxX [Gemmata massiliana]